MRVGKSPKVLGFSPKGRNTVSANAAINDVTDYVHEAVRARQQRGRKLAISEVARLLGFSERRVRAYVDKEVRQVLAWEMLRVQERQQAEIEDRLKRMDAEAAILRARLGQSS